MKPNGKSGSLVSWWYNSEKREIGIQRRETINAFSEPKFTNQIVGLSKSYGELDFWLQNLRPGSDPDATWRSLLIIGSLKLKQYTSEIRDHLRNKDSRVRAWACFALGQCQDIEAADEILSLYEDLSCRVRIHAWQAIKLIDHKLFEKHYLKTRRPFDEMVLVSNDDSALREFYSRVLSKIGYRVASASLEEETMRMANELVPKVIITDNQKNKDNLSGLNMTWNICRSPLLRETIIVMVSADFAEPAFLWNGGDYYLSTPINAHALYEFFEK